MPRDPLLATLMVLLVALSEGCGEGPPASGPPTGAGRGNPLTDEEIQAYQAEFNALWAAWRRASDRLGPVTVIDVNTPQARMDAFGTATGKLGACKESLDAVRRAFLTLAGLAEPAGAPLSPEDVEPWKREVEEQLRSAREALEAGEAAVEAFERE
jgi:hypothetical protein